MKGALEGPPRVGLGVLKRALVACVLITLMSAGAVASAALLQAEDVIDIVREEANAPLAVAVDEIDEDEAGRPQTLMILGSDERFGDKEMGTKPRSDTIILVRLDPKNDAVSVMSLPRDLKVTIPGNTVPTKINAAYEQGGPALTLRTVRQLLSTPERRFRINHVVQIDFSGFQRAINYIGCVYADIDQRYFNDNSNGENYATIDLKPGYQRVCGGDALDYVRFRHTDNDLVRAARQQDFLRQIKNQPRVDRLKDPRRIKTLAKIFARYTDSDAALRKLKPVLSLARLAIFASGKPVREIPFTPDAEEDGGAYLVASQETIAETVDRFMKARTAPAAVQRARRTAPASASRPRPARTRSSAKSLKDVAGLTDGSTPGAEQARLAGPRVDFPVYYPGLRRNGASFQGGLSSEPTTRTYSIRAPGGTLHRAYRMTMRFQDGGFGEFYGIQGTTWRDPPILENPDETRRVGGRRLELHYDGKRLRLVAWRTDDAVYWVSNTLLRELNTKQMLAIAASLERPRSAGG